jgi:Tol biopolymer transport system component
MTGTAPTSPPGATRAPNQAPTPGAVATRTAGPMPSPSPVGFVVGEDDPWIVYEGWIEEAGSVGIRLIRPDGTGDHWAEPEAPIAAGPNGGDGWQLHADWSPDGQQLAFVVDTWPDTNGHRDIWISNADGSDARQLYDCVRPCDSADYPAWSKDGRSVIFVTWDLIDNVAEGSQLRLVDVASGDVTTLAATEGGNYFAYPRWSPDGERIVAQIETFSNATTESTFVGNSIALVDLGDAPRITRLTELEDMATYPDWHPTDDLIVYSAGDGSAGGDGSSDLYVMRPDGSDKHVLVSTDLQSAHPSWLPDGSGVIFIQMDNGDITTAVMWTVHRDGTGLEHATTDGPHFGPHPNLRPLP